MKEGGTGRERGGGNKREGGTEVCDMREKDEGRHGGAEGGERRGDGVQWREEEEATGGGRG